MKTNKTCINVLKPTVKILTSAAFCFVCVACFGQLVKNTETGRQLKIVFQNKVGGEPFVLGNSYTNSFGETYTIQKFRYYITQLLIVDSSDMSEQFFPDDYYLIDAGDSSTRTVRIPLSLKRISYLSFLVGVDSAANTSGTQEGALDPANGMFWTWNSGYVMAKLQGTSPSANAPGNSFSFDVGGFKTGENAARKIELNLNANGKDRSIRTIVIDADINKWFDGDGPVKIADHPGCHEPGKLAMQVADNYSTMFSVERARR